VPLSNKQFVCDDTDGIEICAEGVILPEENLGSHVSWCTAGLMRIFCLPVPGDAEIGDAGVALLVEDDILGLYVAVDDVSLVEVVEALDQAANQEF